MNLNKVTSFFIASVFSILSFSCSQEVSNPINLESDNLNTFSRSIAVFNQIKIATYNAQNAFDPAKKTDLNSLAEAIKTMNVDVLALQEVKSKENLKSFVDKYLSTMQYTIINNESGKLALLTKLPTTEVKTEIPSDISTNLLQVGLKANDNYKFNMFVGKIDAAKGTTLADADKVEKVRQFFRAYEKADRLSNYFLAGDFTGEPDSSEMLLMLDPRASGLTFHDLVVEDIGLGKDIFSYSKANKKGRMDYLMPSGGMYQEYIRQTVQIDNKARVITPNNIFLKTSNHLPIIATFSTEKDITVNKK